MIMFQFIRYACSAPGGLPLPYCGALRGERIAPLPAGAEPASLRGTGESIRIDLLP